jgi:hypothetical protein
MGVRELDPLLERIRTLVADIDQLEGDGVDEPVVAARRHQLAQLKALLAKVAKHEATRDLGAAA